MAGTLKEITKNYEKLHRLQMIDTILCQMHSYVHDVLSRVEDEFDDCVDFEDYITESIIKNTKENLVTLNKYLGFESNEKILKKYLDDRNKQ